MRISKEQLICTMGLLILVVAAFFCPRNLFRLQDGYQMERIWQGTRNSMDLEALYGSYGSLRDRLTAFAKRQEEMEFHVTDTKYSVNQQLLDTLELVVSQECFQWLEILGRDATFLFEQGYTINQWKQYVIYNDIHEKEEATVLISGWYIDLTTREDITVKMLIDTETYGLYYIQILDASDNGWSEYYWNEMYKGNVSWQEYMMEYWFEYYEAGETPVQTYESYFADSYDVDKETVKNENVMDSSGKKNTWKARMWELEMELPYFDHFLMWKLKAESSNSIWDKKEQWHGTFSMGIVDIADLIPEFQEDS